MKVGVNETVEEVCTRKNMKVAGFSKIKNVFQTTLQK